jgi:hypothetical protein
MLRALDDLTERSVTLEFTVYSLCPVESEEKRDLLELGRSMTRTQVQAIRDFLEFVQENAENGAWFRQYITPALEIAWA